MPNRRNPLIAVWQAIQNLVSTDASVATRLNDHERRIQAIEEREKTYLTNIDNR